MNRGPEILAPAGSMDALKAAVECGADAVYLGAGHFNARRNAQNFSKEDLKMAIEYCHVRGVKVHLTLNTLVSDDELPEAMNLIETACQLGVDAMIVQDLGVAALVRAAAPDMELHASTQMAVMTPEGFRALARLGFQRVVLPREFSFDEILAAREATRDTGLELEMFIHGALCMCVSGQCYLSAMMGGRSGNRGLCAQPCRLRFSTEQGRRSDHALSLRDLSAVEEIPALYEAGVLSFKIEGRMKRPEYVAAAVTACRNAVAGTRDATLSQNLDAVFSRSGHTDGYLKHELGHEMFGIRRKDDVVAAAPILKDLAQLYQKETRSTPVAFTFEARRGEPMRLAATWTDAESKQTVCASVDSEKTRAEAAQHPSSTDRIVKQLQKTGGTGFRAETEDIALDADPDLFYPASVLNDLRRRALAELTAEIQKLAVKQFDRAAAENLLHTTAGLPDTTPTDGSAIVDTSTVEASTFVRLRRAEQLPTAASAQENTAWILPLDAPASLMEQLAAEKLPFGVEVPRGLYGHTDRVRAQLATAKSCGASFAYAATLDSLMLARAAGLPVLGGFTMNVFNRVSCAEYRRLGVSRMTLSQELTFRQMEILSAGGKSPEENGLLVYGRSPLMLMRNRPDGLSADDFANPAVLPGLTDRKGIRFPVTKNGGAYELLNSRPLYLADHRKELPDGLFRLFWFTDETADDVEETLHRYEIGAVSDTEFTRGLYQKGVL